LRGKKLVHEDNSGVVFACEKNGTRWRFDLQSHSLIPLGAGLDPEHSASTIDVPTSIKDADRWFAEQVESRPCSPSHPPGSDRAIARWGDQYFMVTCTLGPFVAVAYAFGYESSMILLAEHPRVFAHLASRYVDYFAAHYAWAARAGYDGGHMVESWCSADTISPDVYREWIAPIHRDAARMIQSKGLKADLYLPGYCMPLLGALRGQGWAALRIDDLCRGREQDIAEARRILGAEQCLFGNMSSYALLRADWEDIAARAHYQYESAGTTGRFIISNGSGICDQTSTHMVDRWLDYAVKLAKVSAVQRTE
jgi:uroporphyrinogen-III decarboxylase